LAQEHVATVERDPSRQTSNSRFFRLPLFFFYPVHILATFFTFLHVFSSIFDAALESS
jgi:hypothetical protein